MPGCKMKFTSDIDIDFGSRDNVLKLLEHIPASMIKDGKLSKHNTGVYFTDIPVDPFSGCSSLDYKDAEQRGYIKLDFLNLNLYSQLKDEQHLIELMHTEPAWEKLYDKEFCSKLIHIGNHYNSLIQMPQAVNSIEKLSMFLAVIRPAKRHLIGKMWDDIAQTVWDKDPNGGYAFKRSHSIAYSHLVVVNMNLLSS